MFNKKRAYFVEASGGAAKVDAKVDADKPVLSSEVVAKPAGLIETKNPAGSYLKPTIISEGFEFIGEIKAACHMSIDGVVRGSINAPSVHIGTNGFIDAHIHCENITIKGQFSGTLDCHNLTIVTDAVADGQLNFESITMQRGGIVKGSLKKKQCSPS